MMHKGLESISTLLKVPVQQNMFPTLTSTAHVLAKELTEWFNEKKKFGMYLGIIKRRGEACVRLIFAEMKEQSNRSPKLFMWKCSKKYEKDL